MCSAVLESESGKKKSEFDEASVNYNSRILKVRNGIL